MKKAVVISALFFMVVNGTQAMVVSDFDDGTFQGWTIEDPDHSTLCLLPDGEGGYHLAGIDSASNYGGAYAVAPESYTGDLSIYTGIQWDEYITDNRPYTTRSTRVLLYGLDTKYVYIFPDWTRQTWYQRNVPFEASGWTHRYGDASFEDVLANVDKFVLGLEVNTKMGEEAIVDNIALVPEPSSILLLGSALFFLKKRRS